VKKDIEKSGKMEEEKVSIIKDSSKMRSRPTLESFFGAKKIEMEVRKGKETLKKDEGSIKVEQQAQELGPKLEVIKIESPVMGQQRPEERLLSAKKCNSDGNAYPIGDMKGDFLINGGHGKKESERIGMTERTDDVCFKLLVNFINYLDQSGVSLKGGVPMSLESFGLSRSSASNYSNEVGWVEKSVSEHEGKIMFLNNVGEQVVNKTKQLDFITGSLVDYGMNDLEPWRKNVNMIVDQVVNEVQNLGNKADVTYNGCAELERRINILEEELVNTKRENMILRNRLDELETSGLTISPSVQNCEKMECVDQIHTKSEMEEAIKELNNEDSGVKRKQ